MPGRKKRSLPERRPAETVTGAAAVIGAALAVIFHVDNPVVTGAIVVVVGGVPAAVTWLVNLLRQD